MGIVCVLPRQKREHGQIHLGLHGSLYDWPMAYGPARKKKTQTESETVTVPSSPSVFFFRPLPFVVCRKEGELSLKFHARASALPLDQFGNKPKSAT